MSASPTQPRTANVVSMSWEILDRMERAVAKVRERLLRATAALNQAGVPYAVVGGNAVASGVARVDEGAGRNTPGIELLIQRWSLPRIVDEMLRAGFVRHGRYAEFGHDIRFLDGPDGRPQQGVRFHIEGEKSHPTDLLPAPVIETVDDPANFRALALRPLVNMMLSSNRNEDDMLIRDLIGVGLVEVSWIPKVPVELRPRLRQILDTPDG
jgi:hypothetical protein